MGTHMIFHFNPSCEMAVRQDRASYTPPKGIASMEDDLAALMTFVSTEADAIVGPRPDDALLDFWAPTHGRRDYIDWAEAARRARDGEPTMPWGQSRAEMCKFGLAERAARWTWRDLLSRRTSVETEWALAKIIGSEPAAKPVIVSTEDELRAAMTDVARATDGIVIKSLWSASGRGVRFFSKTADAEAALIYGKNCIKADGGAVVETKLNRLAEFSYLFHKTGDDIVFDGINRYHSTDGGAMGWEIAGPQPNIFDVAALEGAIANTTATLANSLRITLKGSGYEGPIGVDAMVYRGDDGEPRLRPCTEANIRFCMGHVAQGLMRGIARGVSVRWRTWHFGSDGEWDAFCDENAAAHPVVRDSEGRIVSGFFRLTTAGRGVRFGACGWAGENGVAEG